MPHVSQVRMAADRELLGVARSGSNTESASLVTSTPSALTKCSGALMISAAKAVHGGIGLRRSGSDSNSH
jgi:hypothetical protein